MKETREPPHRFSTDPPISSEGKPLEDTVEQLAFWAGYDLALLDVEASYLAVLTNDQH